MKPYRPIRARARSAGFSLLELVLATALVSGTLASSLALIRDGMEISRETDRRATLANYAVSTIESQMALVAANWTTGADDGDWNSDGWNQIRYTVVRSDLAVDGGKPGELMMIRVVTFFDEDNDGGLDSDEMRVVYRTKIGKFASYEAKASS